MTWKGGSRVNAKKYCLSSTRQTLEAAALTGGLWTSGAAATSIRPNSLQGRCHILITLDCWNTQGGGNIYIYIYIYIYIASIQSKEQQSEIPLCIHLSKNCTNVSNCLTWRMFQSPVVTLYFSPLLAHFFFFKLFSRHGRVGKERSRSLEGLFGKKTSNRKFSADGINMHTSIAHPFSIKSLNPLSG